jgi:hypothetical protein
VTDWELGALFWNCLKSQKGDADAANQLVKKKFLNQLGRKDLYFFLGTTYSHHKKKAPNPFSIVGVFYPPNSSQIEMGI